MKYKYKLAMIVGIMGLFSSFTILFMYDHNNHNTKEKEIHHEIDYNIKVMAQQIEEDTENLIVSSQESW